MRPIPANGSSIGILGLGTAVPRRAFTQAEAFALAGYEDDRFRGLFERSGIETRHLHLDPARFRADETPDEMHARYREGVLDLASRAARRAVEAARVDPGAIGLVVAASSTGYLCPDLSTLLAAELGLSRGVERAGLQGMGCAGAMPALQRAFDFVAARGRTALAVAAEICSAAYFVDDDPETAVGNAICADGAAAAVLGPLGEGTGARIDAFASGVAPEHLDRVGFSRREGRLRIVLKRDIPEIAGPVAVAAIEGALSACGRPREDVRRWVLHPGGPRVLAALARTLRLGEEELAVSRSVYRRYGNMSSPTVLFVLEETCRQRPPDPGDTMAMLALGPGLAAECAILMWKGGGSI